MVVATLTINSAGWVAFRSRSAETRSVIPSSPKMRQKTTVEKIYIVYSNF